MKKSRSTVLDELNPGFTERSNRGRAARRRGGEYEREVANLLRELYPRARRSVGQAREGAEAPDVVGTPWWVECGKGTTTAIHDKVRQGLADRAACPDATYKNSPVVVFSRHERAGLDLVTMERGEFLDLLRLLLGCRP